MDTKGLGSDQPEDGAQPGEMSEEQLHDPRRSVEAADERRKRLGVARTSFRWLSRVGRFTIEFNPFHIHGHPWELFIQDDLAAPEHASGVRLRNFVSHADAIKAVRDHLTNFKKWDDLKGVESAPDDERLWR